MKKRNVNDAVDKFLAGGGEVTRLRYANQKELNKSNRNFYHKEKADCGSYRSEDIIAAQEERESTLIFSRTDRWTE